MFSNLIHNKTKKKKQKIPYHRMHTTPCTFPTLAASYQPHNTRSRPLHDHRTDPDQSQRQAGMYVNCRDRFQDCLNNYVKKEGGGDDNNKLKKHTRNQTENY